MSLSEAWRYIVQDWKANSHNQFSRSALVTYRMGHLIDAAPLPSGMRTALKLLHRVVNAFVLKVINAGYIQPSAEIGRGLRLPNGLNGVFINRHARIGSNVVIYQQVTLGDNFAIGDGVAPAIGDEVVIGAGAKIVGGVTVGDGAVIGANSVVSKDIPENSVAIGNPARIVKLDRTEAERLARASALGDIQVPQG